MTEPNYFDQIENYLTGKLSAQEAKAFEQEVAANENLAMELELQKLEHEGMEMMVEKELKANMASWGDQPPPDPFSDFEKPKNTNGKTWFFALVGALLLAGAWWFFGTEKKVGKASPVEQPKTESTQEKEVEMPPPANMPVAEEPTKREEKDDMPPTKKQAEPENTPNTKQYAYADLSQKAYDVPPTFGSRLKSGERDDENSNLTLAAKEFDAGKYTDALKLLGPPNTKEQSTVRYLRGHTYFMVKNYRAAAQEFAVVASDEFLPNYQEAQWYLLLSYVAQMPEMEKEFRDLAQRLADDEYSDYREQAKELLAEVK